MALFLFIICMFFNGSTYSGYSCSSVEIAPNFSGMCYGISTTVAFFYAMTGPTIAGALTPNETMEEWKKVFWVVFSNYFITGIIYCVFIKTEVQPWNEGINSKMNLSSGNLETKLEQCQI
ncbi:putative transporter, partial [Armadillidium nasatum]